MDKFFWKSESGKPSISNAEAFQSSDPAFDHAAVRVILREEQIGDMQPLEALRHPVKMRSDRWREKREAWQQAVESELPAAITDTGSDPFRASELPAVRALHELAEAITDARSDPDYSLCIATMAWLGIYQQQLLAPDRKRGKGAMIGKEAREPQVCVCVCKVRF